MALNVLDVTPPSGATGISQIPAISVQFDQGLNTSTVDDTNVVVARLGARTVVTGPMFETSTTGVSYTLDSPSFTEVIPSTLTFTTTALTNDTINIAADLGLEANTEYSIILGLTIESSTGDVLDSVYSWKFTTGSAELTIPPDDESDPLYVDPASEPVFDIASEAAFELLSATPTSDTYGIEGSNQAITLTFSENVDSTSVTSDTVQAMARLVFIDTEETPVVISYAVDANKIHVILGAIET